MKQFTNELQHNPEKDMKDPKKQPLSKKAGEKIERFGEKVSNAGAQKVGNVISRAGEKLEHSQDTTRKNFDKYAKNLKK